MPSVIVLSPFSFSTTCAGCVQPTGRVRARKQYEREREVKRATRWREGKMHEGERRGREACKASITVAKGRGGRGKRTKRDIVTLSI